MVPAFAAMCNCLDCPNVFGVAHTAIQNGDSPKNVLEGVVCIARMCVVSGTGQCSHPAAVPTRQTCAASIEHLDLALNELNHAPSAKHWAHCASLALDTIERPFVVCDGKLRLQHANRAAELEMKDGHWLGLCEGCVFLKGHQGALEKSVATLSLSGPASHQHLPLLHNGTDHADLWVRRICGDSDNLALYSITIVSSAKNSLLVATDTADRQSHTGRLEQLPLTPKQHELARHLLAGNNLTEAAKSMGITRATANGHLKGLFMLSMTSRQSELVVWLSLNICA